MQWRQIKTLFILCFLALNIYLLVLLIDKQDEADYSVPDTTDTSFEQQMASENIDIKADLPDDDFKASSVSLKQDEFTKSELEFFDDKEKQQTEVIDQKLVVSRFDEPVPIPKDASEDDLSDLVKDRILLPKSYTFGGWNQDMNVLMFFQKHNDLPIYHNKNGIVLIYLNDDDEMLFYTQTKLSKEESPPEDEMLSENKSLMEPIKAIEALFDSSRLENGDEITEVNMGFHNPLGSGEQVFLFSPTWTITVNDKSRFYVNALEDQVYHSDELTFLTDAVTDTIEKLQTLDQDSELKAYVAAELKAKLDTTEEESE